MQTRYVDKSGPMTRGKRSLDGDEEQQSDMKRPALASVIVEALKVDNLQKLCSSLEPILRRVVSEEVERALAKIGPSRLNGRSSPKRIEGPDGRKLQLQFRSRLSLPLFTGARVEGEQGAAIHVVLVDANTGHVVISGSESVAKLEIVVLEGDFCNEDDEGWSQEEFESHVVREREGKRPLLTGDLQVTLKEGVGTLGELTFTDNSSWIRSRKFRLGLKAASGSLDGVRVREAKTEAFTVKDHRGELYKKHYPPALNDEVWRLEKVGKDGAFHKKLNSFGILVVEDFLRVLVRDAQKLRNMLGSGMSNKMWDALVEHAKTCVLSGKHYVYYADNSRLVGVVFNNIYELSGLISSGDQYYPSDILSESQKVYVDNLVKKAYDNWHEVVEYDGKSLLGFRENSSRSSDSGNELTMGSIDYSNTLENPLQSTCHSDHSEQYSSNLGIPVDGGYSSSNKLALRYIPHTLTSNPHGHFEASGSYHIEDTRAERTPGFTLGRPDSSSISPLSEFHHPVSTTNNPLDDCWYHQENTRQKPQSEDILTEEEIRARSHEMLENEDIQQLLRIWSMGGNNGYVNGQDTGYPFTSFIPPTPPVYAYSEEDDEGDRTRSGRAVVGWLKIKAAMRWGFFIRKKAAERRAQIVEIHDEDDDDDE